ncbi:MULTISPECIES: hypothetical protein [Klebsiella]|uniref:hypothetical protein n=1 Tax=Klebsiella TaxID=570 RepID=UPI0003FB6206|nr:MULTISPECIES: hypothetical protein [Klebsiella]HAT1600742.1 hypothetical protein [Raoultella ornithinolytica]HDT3094459.1 hypothetical protein [Klebsiella pneumoniae subsp. pneumoniae]HEH6363341.1 hypothetical protein [Raoultella planticola]ELA0654944.1 hypothetical protein [Klebsiella pneumoniae]MBM7157861.1 hypothetical protein [Klebsiella pneumoniae]
MKALNYNPEDPDKMQLPAGKTCGDCAHIRRCKAIFGHTEIDKYCDWSPSRAVFSQPSEQEGGAA